MKAQVEGDEEEAGVPAIDDLSPHNWICMHPVMD